MLGIENEVLFQLSVGNTYDDFSDDEDNLSDDNLVETYDNFDIMYT